MRVYSPPYTPQANGVVERTIGLVKNWIAKKANSHDWSTKAVEIGQALNDRHHQKAHTQEGAHWRGNDEVDRYVQQRKVVFVGTEKWDRTPQGRVVPEEYVDEVVRSVHEALGHPGVLPTR
ncbi:hypothetical protein AMECASPLE_029318 [Ameca splendens]|uniref:Integrase catalytic domain-containing protein n=1 Tax=Ameca splendens TaxID=208324 RepID=A0ABV0YU99_9TELE